VLSRVVGLFARRGFNIVSLAVAPTDDERFSRITVVVDVESAPLEQVVKQLDKLVNVVKITELAPGDSVQRELLLATVSATPEIRGQIIELVGVFEGRILGVGPDLFHDHVADAGAPLMSMVSTRVLSVALNILIVPDVPRVGALSKVIVRRVST